MKTDNETFFITLAETLSFSKAAQILGVSTASVSKQLKNIENDIGVSLIFRNTRSIRLTDAGEDFLKSSKKIIDIRGAFFDKITDTDEHCQGTISMTVPTVYASTELIEIINKFKELHNNVRFNIATNHQNSDIIGLPFDLAIRLGVLEDSGLISRKLTDVSLHICASPKYLKRLGSLKSLHDFSKADLIILDGFSLTKRVIDQYFGGINLSPEKFVVSTNDPKVQLNAVLKGMGVTVLTDYIAKPFFESGELVHIMPSVKLGALPLSLLYPRNKQLPSRVRKFIDFILERYNKDN